MALPTVGDVQKYLRIETPDEDAVLGELLTQATAEAEAMIGRPIIAESRTMSGITAHYDDLNRHGFYLPLYPVATADPDEPVVTDQNGDVVLDTTYSVDGRTGRIIANTGEYFGAYPFSIVAKVGLSAHPNYATKIEPLVRALILGIVSVLYHQRNPNAVSESEDGGSVQYRLSEYPAHLERIAAQLRGSRVRS